MIGTKENIKFQNNFPVSAINKINVYIITSYDAKRADCKTKLLLKIDILL